MESVPMTLNGYKKLQEELRRLKNIERPQVVEAIASARALGDLSENAEYHAAKDRQGLIEARINDLESKLGLALIIDVSKIKSDKIKFGASVDLMDDETGKTSGYQIVGSDEADIKKGLLPITSPIARGIIGKSAGNSIEISTPSGVKYYTVVKVEYKSE